jgi:hypothetical protein
MKHDIFSVGEVVFVSLVFLVVGLAAVALWEEKFYNEVEVVIVEPVVIEEDIRFYFDFDGFRCSTLKQEPDWLYSVKNQTASTTMECHPDIMDIYRPAVRPPVEEVD